MLKYARRRCSLRSRRRTATSSARMGRTGPLFFRSVTTAAGDQDGDQVEVDRSDT